MSEKKDFSKYGDLFQEELVYLILQERPFCEQMEEVLDPKYFNLKYLAIYVKSIFDFRKKYVKHPQIDNMPAVFASMTLDKVDRELIEAFHEKIKNNPSAYNQAKFVKEISLDFCKKMKLADALMNSIKHLEDENFDKIKQEIEGALKLGADRNFGLDYKADFDDRYKDNYRDPVPTGWDFINKLMAGGLAHGELGLVIAPSGVGKSFALSNIGAAAIKHGKTVVYYTLELTDGLVGRRFDSHFSGYSLNELDQHKEEIREVVNAIQGTLIVKEYATKSASLVDIAKHLDTLISNGVNPDIVIVDYVDLLKSNSNYEEKRFELESTYEGLRGLAKTFNVPVWSASQTNRGGSKQEYIDNDSVAESYNKIFVADFIMTISRTPSDVDENTGRVFISKNRLGRDKVPLPAIIDNEYGVIKILSSDKELEEYNKKIKVAHEKQLLSKLDTLKQRINKNKK